MTLLAPINRRFGTYRGLIRYLLGYAELACGRLRRFGVADRHSIRRLVFVCQGNICRSAYAEKLALEHGLNVASLGLATTTGAASPAEAVAAAGRAGLALDAHRATDWKDFDVQPGDLLLVMEIRQAHAVRRLLAGRTDAHVALLGMWCSPVSPHLHDPFTLSDDYFDTCFARVRQAVARLAADFPSVRKA